MIDIGDADFYKIFYKDNSGKLTSVLFFPTEFFPYFKQLALEKNEKIKIKNSSNSFDF
ncbi:MAG: hypothetical protein H7331_00880 [Bacteroidia bacterium]|nr:hypothetical protein [Bacteroidia bacterium]